jgi:hypothetical protein
VSTEKPEKSKEVEMEERDIPKFEDLKDRQNFIFSDKKPFKESSENTTLKGMSEKEAETILESFRGDYDDPPCQSPSIKDKSNKEKTNKMVKEAVSRGLNSLLTVLDADGASKTVGDSTISKEKLCGQEYIGTLKVEPKESFPGGATRSDSRGKGRFDLIPYGPLKRLALRYEYGAVQHGDNNWRKGQPKSRIFAAMIRHAYQWLAGYRDEDHLAAVAWNVFALMYFEEKDND